MTDYNKLKLFGTKEAAMLMELILKQRYPLPVDISITQEEGETFLLLGEESNISVAYIEELLLDIRKNLFAAGQYRYCPFCGSYHYDTVKEPVDFYKSCEPSPCFRVSMYCNACSSTWDLTVYLSADVSHFYSL